MKLSAVASLFAAFGCSQTSAHGFLSQPRAQFVPGVDVTGYSATINSTVLFPGGIFNSAPTINIKSFVKHYKKSKYKSLKELIEDNQVLVSSDSTASCGFTTPEKLSYGALNDTVYWGRSDDITLDVGLNHPGPCETWCGNKRVQHNTNCDVTYAPPSGKGASPIPIDTSVCKDAKRLTFYWIAMHGANWQIYINCVNINGGTGGASPSPSKKTKTATTISKPKAANPATAPAKRVVKPKTEQSEVANEASTSGKCSRRRIRG